MSGTAKAKKPKKPMPPGREATRPAKTGPSLPLAPPGAGRRIVTASWIGTGLLVLTSIPAAVSPSTLAVPALVVALVMFFGGVGLFGWAYVVAIGRSRTDAITLSGVYGLAGSTPGSVRTRLFGSLAVEVVVALSCAGARVHSSLAFGILASMWGVGAAGLWGARYGAFPPRAV